MDTIEHVNPDGDRVTIQVSDSGRNIVIGDNVTIGENVFLWDGTVIGDGVTIKQNCQFGRGVRLGEGVHIGRDSHLGYTTVGKGSYLEGEAHTQMDVNIGERVRIGFYCDLGPGVVIEDDVSIGERFTTVSYTTIKSGSQFGNFVHLDRDITIGEKVIIENGVCLFGEQEVPDFAQVSYTAPVVHVR